MLAPRGHSTACVEDIILMCGQVLMFGGAVNYPLTLLTNIRTLAFYTPRNNTLGNPPGENSTQKQYFGKSPWEKRNPETIPLEIPLGKIQLTMYQFPKIGGADTPQPIKLYSGMVKWKDNFFKLESCAQ